MDDGATGRGCRLDFSDTVDLGRDGEFCQALWAVRKALGELGFHCGIDVLEMGPIHHPGLSTLPQDVKCRLVPLKE